MTPVAWLGPEGQLMLDEFFQPWKKLHPEKAALYRPLYLEAVPC